MKKKLFFFTMMMLVMGMQGVLFGGGEPGQQSVQASQGEQKVEAVDVQNVVVTPEGEDSSTTTPASVVLQEDENAVDENSAEQVEKEDDNDEVEDFDFKKFADFAAKLKNGDLDNDK